MSALFEAALEIPVGSRGMCGVGTVPRMAMEMGQELMAETANLMSRLCIEGISATTPMRVRRWCANSAHWSSTRTPSISAPVRTARPDRRSAS